MCAVAAQYEEVLIRQELMLTRDYEAGPSRIAHEICPAHSMLDGRAHRRLALGKVDVDQCAARPQRTRYPAQERRAFGEVVVRVDDEGKIAR